MPAPIYNVDWLSANATRNYPLDDRATRQDNTGKLLPNSILSDLNLWRSYTGPDRVGAYVSAVTISPRLVTVVLSGCAGLGVGGEPDGHVPLAAVTLTKPITPGQNYPLTSYGEDAAGWIAFGPSINELEPGQWNFSDPAQTAIIPRLVHQDALDGVLAVKRRGFAAELKGVVELRSVDPSLLVIEPGLVTISGDEKRCIVFRLNTEEQGNDIYTKVTGPCGGSIEGGGCQRSGAITNINGVSPCCTDGRIDLVLQETDTAAIDSHFYLSYVDTRSPTPTPTPTPTGTVAAIDFTVGLDQLCPARPTNFRFDKLDNCDTTDQCAEFSDVSAVGSELLDYSSPEYQEPGFPGTDSQYVHYSGTFSATLAAIGGIRVEGVNDGLLFLIGSGDTIAHSGSTFTVPAGAIALENNSGHLIEKEVQVNASGGVTVYPPTTQKTITKSGGGSYVYSIGNNTTHQTGVAQSLAGIGLTYRPMNSVISSSELAAVSAGGSYKFAHIACGIGRYAVKVIAYPVARVNNGGGQTEGAGTGGGSPP